MKRVFTFSLFMALLSTVVAQPVINRGDVLQVGSQFFSNNPTTLVDPGPAGEDVIWNFSAIVPDSVTFAANVVNASGTPYALQFPTANVAFTLEEEGFASYQYNEVSNSTWLEVGNVVEGFLSTEYSNPRTRLQFPLTYNSQWSDDFAYTDEFLGAQITVMGEGTSNVTVDAYGTLILPHHTFDDVLRIKYVDVVRDTSELGQGLSEKTITNQTSYIWFSPSYHGPLCIYEQRVLERTVYLTTPDTVIVDTETEEDMSFQYDPMSGSSAVPDVQPGLFQMSLSPNPFEGNLNLAFTANRSGEMRFLLHDLLGNVIYQENLNGNSGENTVSIAIPDISGGTYVAILRSSDGADVQKLVKISTQK